MQIPIKSLDKLRRYLINADPFLWNVLDKKNKKGRLKELQALGYLNNYSSGSNPVYSKINQDLLVELGVEGILEHIVVPRIKALFAADDLQYFRRCWEQGQTPPLDYFKKRKLYRKHHFTSNEVVGEGWDNYSISGYKEPAFVFVHINTQYDFVEHWTVFAGLWFEEIEPLLDPDRREL